MNFWKKIIICLLLSVSSAAIAITVPQLLDEIIAIVNNDIILQSDIDIMLDIVRMNIKNTGQQIPNESVLRHQILERLIIDEIIIQIAEKMKIQIPDQAVDIAITNIAAQNGLALAQLKKQLLINGISFKHYHNNIRREMIIEEVRNHEVRPRITILPQEVDSLIAQLNSQINHDVNVNLSHILIPLAANSTHSEAELAINTINKIITKLKQGDDFSKLAINYSTCHTASNGGLIGWSKIKELPIIFSQQIQHAKKGDVIGPIRSNVGFHILKLNDIRYGKIPILVTEVKARHILIKPSPITSNKQAHAKIQRIAKQIKIGQITFTEAAKKYSQDPYSASRGGELGWNMPNIYDPGFRDGLMKLKKGEISQPICSSLGWHLIQLEGTRQVNKTDTIQKDQAYRLLFNRKFNEEMQIWIQELQTSAYIKILNNNNAQ